MSSADKISDAEVEAAARSLSVTIPAALGQEPTDSDEMAFEGDREIGPIWSCYKVEARAALEAAAATRRAQSAVVGDGVVAWMRQAVGTHPTDLTDWPEVAEVWVEDGFTVIPLKATQEGN